MRHAMGSPFALVVLSLLGSDSPKEFDDRTEIAGIEGTWQIVTSGTPGHQTHPDTPCIETLQGGKFVYSENGVMHQQGTYTSRVDRVPCYLDETTAEGITPKGTKKFIYRRNDDRLLTAYGAQTSERPRSFDEDGIFVIVWKRVR